MKYNIDGEILDIDIGSKMFTDGYFDGTRSQNRRHEFSDLGEVHDKYSNNPYGKGTIEYKTYKAGFIQCIY